MSMCAILHHGGHSKYINSSCANVLLPGNQFIGSFHKQLIRPSSNHLISTIRSRGQAQPSEFSSSTWRSSEISVADASSPRGQSIIGDRWREYHGCDEWQGFLEPLDPALREEIMKYGDLAQLSYDAFNADTKRCIYEEADLFQLNPKLLARGYKVTKYIYEMPEVHLIPEWLQKWRQQQQQQQQQEEEEVQEGVWVGFIAVMEDEEEIRRIGRRDVVVAWRGTVTKEEWLEDMDGALMVPDQNGTAVDSNFHPNDVSDHVGIERGFWTLYASGENSAREQVTEEIRRIISVYGSDPLYELSITITGHSLGAALALVSAYDVASLGLNSSVPISVISFAGPRVGNAAFKRKLHDELKVNVLRVVNARDVVPKVPGSLLALTDDDYDEHVGGGEPTWYEMLDILLHAAHPSYIHVGVALHLDNSHSPFLKPSATLGDAHNLEVYLHLLDGYRSTDEPFVGPRTINYQHVSGHVTNPNSLSNRLLQLYVDFLNRNVALVNKSSSLLHDDLQIPPNWWTSFVTTNENTTL